MQNNVKHVAKTMQNNVKQCKTKNNVKQCKTKNNVEQCKTM